MCSLHQLCDSHCRKHNRILSPHNSTHSVAIFNLGTVHQDFEKCKARLIERGESFRETALLSRGKIGACADPFISDGAVRKSMSTDLFAMQWVHSNRSIAGHFDVRFLARGAGCSSPGPGTRQAFPGNCLRISARRCWVMLRLYFLHHRVPRRLKRIRFFILLCTESSQQENWARLASRSP